MGGLPGAVEPVAIPFSEPTSQSEQPTYEDLLSRGAVSPVPAYTAPYNTSVNESAYPFQVANNGGSGQNAMLDFQQTSDGSIITHNATVNSDPKALLDFFLQQSTPPGMSVHIRGTHSERRTRLVTDAEGKTRTESYTITITDFETDIPTFLYIQPIGTLYNAPDRHGNVLSIPELMKKYVESNKKIKSISMNKHVVWNYDQLSQAIKNAIRASGYHGSVHVSYPMHGGTITVASDSTLQKMSESSCIKCLCIVSCMWIVFYPIYCLIRDRMDKTLRADFNMGISEQDWFNQNYMTIVGNARRQFGGPENFSGAAIF